MEKQFSDENNLNYLYIETKRSNTELTKFEKISNFSGKKEIVSSVKVKSYWERFKKGTFRIIESNLMQIFIILISCFSVLNNDFRLCALDKSVDSPFHHINEFIFCFFLIELILLCLCQSNFINSFYFWIDIISLISLIPETAFLWNILILDHSINHNVEAGTKASALGAKSSKLLKLVKIMSLIRVVRITNIVKATRGFTANSKSNFAKNQIEEIKKIYKLGMRSNIALDLQNIENLKLSLKYNRESLNKDTKIRNLIRAKTIFIGKTPKGIQKTFNEVSKINRAESATHFLKLNKKKDRSFDLSDDQMNKFEEKELNDKIEMNKKIFESKLNIIHQEFKEMTFQNDYEKIQSLNKNQKENENSESNCSDSLFDSQPSFCESISKDIDILNLKKEIVTQCIEEKTSTNLIVENSKMINSIIKNHNDDLKMLSEDSDDEGKKTIIKTNKLLSSSKNFKLQNNLSEKIIQKVVIIVLLIIVIFPIIELDSVLEWISPSELVSKNFFCYHSISKLITAAKSNPIYLKGLNITLNNCFSNQSQDDKSFIVSLNLTSNSDFIYLKNLYPGYKFLSEYNIPDLDDYIENNRVDSFYLNLTFSEDTDSTTILYDNSVLNFIKSLLNLVKTVVVGIVLIFSAIYLNKDVIRYVINPLDNIFSTLQKHLQNFDQYKPENEEENYLDGVKENSLSEKQTKKMETYLIEMTIKKLVSLISISIGKQILMIIPYCDLNNNFVSLNCNNPGIALEVSFLYLKIGNTDEFFKDYQEKALVVINKIYYLFHSYGNVLKGESVACGNVIIWKRKKEFLESVLNYFNLITNEEIIQQEKLRNLKNEPIDKFLTNSVNLSVVCGVKFISSLFKEVGDFSEIIRKYKLQVTLFVDFGIIYHGYFSSIHKLSEIYVGSNISDAYKFTESSLPNFERPAMYLTKKVYSMLRTFLKKTIYPCGILLNNRSKEKQIIYKQYVNYEKMDEIFKNSLNKKHKNMSRSTTLKTVRKTNDIEEILNSSSKNIEEDIILYDSVSRKMISDFNPQIKFLINFSIKKIYKKKYDIALKSFEDAIKIKCPDITIKLLIEQLLEFVKRNNKEGSNLNYTIFY